MADANEIARVFREDSGRAVATLIRLFGDIDLVEDAVQDAFVVALRTWPAEGLPRDPCAWIVSTGRHRVIDRLRRESLGRSIVAEAAQSRSDSGEPPPELEPMDDDLLRLIFTCCHPALGREAQVALTLRLLAGLPTREVARAFLIEEATMAKRLTRAKRKIREATIPFRVPEANDLPKRMPPVLAVLYLIYNAGADNSPGTNSGQDLAAEGIRLARLLRELLPKEPEVGGLLALLLLNESRRSARFASDGSLVQLRDQDRAAWDHDRIREGEALLRECRARHAAGPYQLQAAIQAVHAAAPTAGETDWPRIVALYDELARRTKSSVVELNRAIAVGEVDGPAAALDLVGELDLESYYLFHATRADLLQRLGRSAEATTAYQRAAELAPTNAEREFLRARAGALSN